MHPPGGKRVSEPGLEGPRRLLGAGNGIEGLDGETGRISHPLTSCLRPIAKRPKFPQNRLRAWSARESALPDMGPNSRMVRPSEN
jgi:hypothetical protein